MSESSKEKVAATLEAASGFAKSGAGFVFGFSRDARRF